MSNDDIIRNYLKAQKDPNSLIDHERVEELKSELNLQEDPVQRVKLISEIEQLNTPPLEEIRQEFISHAASWADEHGVSVAALIEEGADENDLLEASLINGPSIAESSPKVEQQPEPGESAGSNGSGKRGTQKDVIKHIKRTRKPFTAPQVVQATKVSRSTAAAAINKLLAEGVVKDTGEEESGTRGRAAKVYVYDRD